MADIAQEGQVALATQRLRVVALETSWARTYAWPAMRKFVCTKPLGALGGALILLMVLTALGADVLAPYDPYEINQQLQFQAPSLEHWFGTDEFGVTC